MTPIERQEGQRLLDYNGPGLSQPVVYGELLRGADARLMALIAGRDAGMLSEAEYFEEVETLCNGDFSGLHGRQLN